MYDFDFETKTLISKECQDTDDVNTMINEYYKTRTQNSLSE